MSKASSKKPLERIERPAWCPEGYEPPEGFTLLGSRSDAWLLGCLLWELSTRIKLSLQERGIASIDPDAGRKYLRKVLCRAGLCL